MNYDFTPSNQLRITCDLCPIGEGAAFWFMHYGIAKSKPGIEYLEKMSHLISFFDFFSSFLLSGSGFDIQRLLWPELVTYTRKKVHL